MASKKWNLERLRSESSYWRSCIRFDGFLDAGMITPHDLELFRFAETADAAWAQLLASGVTRPAEPKNT